MGHVRMVEKEGIVTRRIRLDITYESYYYMNTQETWNETNKKRPVILCVLSLLL
jgi:hypothetical protein